jgi:hypothetical protein
LLNSCSRLAHWALIVSKKLDKKIIFLPHKATNFTPDSRSSKNSFSPSRTLASQLSSGKCRFPHSEANNLGFLECKYIGQFESLAYSALLDVPTAAVQALRSTDSLMPTTADPSEGNTYRLGGVIVDVIKRNLTCAQRSQRGNPTDFNIFYRAVTHHETAAETLGTRRVVASLATIVLDIEAISFFRLKKSRCLITRMVAEAIHAASCIFDSKIISRGGPEVGGETSATLLSIRAKLSLLTT